MDRVVNLSHLMDVATATLIETRDAVAAGTLSALDAVEAFLARIDQHNPTLNAYREVVADYARQRAGRVDAGEVKGPLAGVPIAIKDCMCHVEGTTACGSRMLEHYRSPFTATAVQRLEDAGAIVLGKTNMDEFAMGSSTETSAFGNTHNPWDVSRVPGGSSGGAATAMAAGLASATLGSDTGGSIRQPAALCGVVGFKPTYGRVSRYGLVAFASSLDQIGGFTRTVADTALLHSVMFGHDERDSTSARVAVDPDMADVDATPGPMRIGIARQFRGEGMGDAFSGTNGSSVNHPAVERAIDQAVAVYRQLGAEIVEVDLPHTAHGIAAYYIVAPAEASSNLARYDGVHFGHRSPDAHELEEVYSLSRSEGFGDEVKRRIMLGTYALSSGYYDAYYNRALKVRRRIAGDFHTAFESCDAILCPTTTGPAFKLGEKTGDPLSMYLNDVYTVTTNLAGIAGISVPGGFTDPKETEGKRLPVGIQLLGPALGETKLLRIARQYERETEHWKQQPSL